VQAADPGEIVKRMIEAQNSIYTLLLHDGKMDRIPRRKLWITQQNLLPTLHSGQINRENLLDDSQQGVKRWLNEVAPLDRCIPVQNFLKNLGVGYQPLAFRYQLFEESLGIGLMGVETPHEIHGDVGVDKNQGFGPPSYPCSISASI
jgi:hypothetical protein